MLLAVLGSACGVVPYLAVTQIIIRILGKTTNGADWTAGALCAVGLSGRHLAEHSLHHAQPPLGVTILKNIRTELTAKLSRVPMGTILDTPSGKFKTLLVDTVEKLELPLAHMIPELTANILIPALMLLYMFVLDWRLA